MAIECTDASTVSRSLVAKKTLKSMYPISIFHTFSSSESNAITSKKGEEYQTVRGGSDILVMKYVLVEVYESLFYAGYGRT